MLRSTQAILAAALVSALPVSGIALAQPATATADRSTTGPPMLSVGTGESRYLAPFYSTGDLTGDRQITQEDLDVLVPALGRTDGDLGWDAVSAADLDADGTITLADLADLAGRMIFDDGTFALTEATVVQMQAAMNAGVVTSVDLTSAYLERVGAYDRSVVADGPQARALNSVIATSDQALAAAEASDAHRAAHGGPRSMLDGLPVLLKDNIGTVDLPTSAGCGCWEDNQTATDATVVSGLRSAGAVVLGKASLDEFAYGFRSMFSTGSPVGEWLAVASPYDTAQTAGGSSGGTGASIAANLAVLGLGTDTGGSIRVPASYNQLVGVRPTVGLTSRDGIVPLAMSQDTSGPMARSVSDAAVALDATVGTDPADPVTADADAHLPESYTAYLDPDALAGAHLAYVPSMLSDNPTVTRLFAAAVADMEARGATVEAIEIDGLDPVLRERSGSTSEFKHDLADYVARHLDPDVADRTIADILDSGHFVTSRRGVYERRDEVTEADYQAWMDSHLDVLAQGKDLVTGALVDGGYDALIYPSAVPYGTFSTNLRLSPNTGMPAVTVPMGQAVADDGTVPGAGVNLEFLGRDFSEGDLLGIAYAYEQGTHHRQAPAVYGPLPGDVVAGPGTDTDAPGDGSAATLISEEKVRVGDTFEVVVRHDAASLRAYEARLEFDADMVELVAVEAGTTGASTVEEEAGAVTVVHTKLGTSPSAQGRTDLVTLTLRAVQPGRIRIATVDLAGVDEDGRVSTFDGGEAAATASHGFRRGD